MRRAVPVAILAGLALAGCTSELKAPYDPGVCYYVVPSETRGEPPRLNVVARDQPQIELCAARLEEMRVRFLRMGGSNREIIGAYQGQFIFIDQQGVKFGRSLTGARFFALARTGDGRLAVPGAIVRDEDGRPVAVAENPPTAPAQ
ncbi:MAG: hypothetical protein Q8S53_09440 [Brevundimonas sp.]|jgi:hypothetical protein|uniref:hypothetical protein n=1 Tax=Brevundimonas sp. TaxID=1871086 RepID=UPI0027352163|nr:hypothetical protein [Brevundimonas sp.]MDP3378577.1 hypothetical protein [Brevundimonas sp.]